MLVNIIPFLMRWNMAIDFVLEELTMISALISYYSH